MGITKLYKHFIIPYYLKMYPNKDTGQHYIKTPELSFIEENKLNAQT